MILQYCMLTYKDIYWLLAWYSFKEVLYLFSNISHKKSFEVKIKTVCARYDIIERRLIMKNWPRSFKGHWLSLLISIISREYTISASWTETRRCANITRGGRFERRAAAAVDLSGAFSTSPSRVLEQSLTTEATVVEMKNGGVEKGFLHYNNGWRHGVEPQQENINNDMQSQETERVFDISGQQNENVNNQQGNSRGKEGSPKK